MDRLKSVFTGILVLGVAFILPGSKEANACSCVPPSVESAWFNADFHFSGIPFWQRLGTQQRYYAIWVQEVFKGCLTPGDVVIAITPNNSAACGVFLELGETYLINGADGGKPRRFQFVTIGLCGYNVTWSSLTQQELEYLYSRPVFCEGGFHCADGSEPVNCFADPCSVASGCDDAVTCISNYCRGCVAEFYDELGYLVCEE